MTMISSADPDFRICRIDFDTLVEIQLDAERQGFSARWTSVSALRGQVEDDSVFLQSLMREEREGSVRAYRCLAIFSASNSEDAGGVATVDLDPMRFTSLERLDRDSDVRKALYRLFSMASGGISTMSKR
ncbi:hypothetical protein [Amycolatopsis tolypomycina]|uniref:hypothetical protein n=1 Tax=Amycolatopsis tolypomycina TaxID=208445 RepID=UPI000B86FE4D|nr:hypothetical protein [Amycolatopsis tolypomycina]